MDHVDFSALNTVRANLDVCKFALNQALAAAGVTEKTITTGVQSRLLDVIDVCDSLARDVRHAVYTVDDAIDGDN